MLTFSQLNSNTFNVLLNGLVVGLIYFEESMGMYVLKPLNTVDYWPAEALHQIAYTLEQLTSGQPF